MKNFEIYRENIIEEATYIVVNRCTVRQAAKEFKISKTTLHKHMKEDLPILDSELKARVQEVFLQNWNERTMRGGQATKRKIENAKAAKQMIKEKK